MAEPKRGERGWTLCRQGAGFLLKYRVSRGVWKNHRVPPEYDTDAKAERYASIWVPERLKALAEEEAGRAASPAAAAKGPPTIRSLHEDWLKLTAKDPKLSPAMRKQYSSNMAIHVLAYPEVADVPLTDLGSGALRAWVRKIRDGGRVTTTWTRKAGKAVRELLREGLPLAPFTCRNVVNTMTAFIDAAMAEEWVALPANPMRHPGVRKEVPEGVRLAGKKTIIHLSIPVAERLLTCPVVPEWRRVRYLVALTSGMDEGELSALRWMDVHEEAGVLIYDVASALALVGPEGWATRSTTKTENRVRKIPVHSLAGWLLALWRDDGWGRLVQRAPTKGDVIFPNPAGEAWRPDVADMLREDLVAAGLPDRYQDKWPFTAKAARRSFSTWLSAAGVSVETRGRLMGHAGATVTEAAYTADDLATMRSAVEKIVLDLTPRPAGDPGRGGGTLDRWGGAFGSGNDAPCFSARPEGLEPPTNGLEGAQATETGSVPSENIRENLARRAASVVHGTAGEGTAVWIDPNGLAALDEAMLRLARALAFRNRHQARYAFDAALLYFRLRGLELEDPKGGAVRQAAVSIVRTMERLRDQLSADGTPPGEQPRTGVARR